MIASAARIAELMTNAHDRLTGRTGAAPVDSVADMLQRAVAGAGKGASELS
jgi:hypothetical protein